MPVSTLCSCRGFSSCHPPRISVSLMTELSGRMKAGVHDGGSRGLKVATDALPEKHSR